METHDIGARAVDNMWFSHDGRVLRGLTDDGAGLRVGQEGAAVR